MDETKLPRQRKVPRRLEVGSSVPAEHRTVEDVYRQTYFEVMDHVLLAIRGRFDQTGFRILCELLCDSEMDMSEFDDVFAFYGSDFNAACIATQLHILHSNLPVEPQSEKGVVKVRSSVKFLQSLTQAECQLYSEVIQIVKLILVMPATNTMSKGSFSALRRLKTWLRNTIGQARLNWCVLLHVHNDETDNLDLSVVANEFVARNSSRITIFGTFA